MDLNNINPGGLPDKFDSRDFKWQEIGAAFPPFNWNKGYDIEEVVGRLPVKDQDGSGSCGGQAWSSYMEVLEAVADQTLEERSAKFIYAQTFVLPGGGSFGRDNSNVCIKQGCAREAVLTSYENGQPPTESFMERPQDIADAIRADAKLARTLSYANVDVDIDLFAQAIEQNHGMVMGIWGQNNGTWGSAFPKPPAKQQWGHWVYAGKAKLINGKKFIGFLNSWGPEIGQKGWQWLGEDYFVLGFFQNGWTMIFNNASVQPFKHAFNSAIRFGDKGDEVKALQQALKADGEFTFPSITGFFGEITRQAVVAFQVKHGIDPQGTEGRIVGPHTRAKLNELFS